MVLETDFFERLASSKVILKILENHHLPYRATQSVGAYLKKNPGFKKTSDGDGDDDAEDQEGERGGLATNAQPENSEGADSAGANDAKEEIFQKFDKIDMYFCLLMPLFTNLLINTDSEEKLVERKFAIIESILQNEVFKKFLLRPKRGQNRLCVILKVLLEHQSKSTKYQTKLPIWQKSYIWMAKSPSKAQNAVNYSEKYRFKILKLILPLI